MVNLLLNLKLDPNLKDKRNRSPLDDALRFQHSRVSSILKSLSEKSSPDLAPSKPRRAKKSVDVQVRNFQNMGIFISIFRPSLTSNDFLAELQLDFYITWWWLYSAWFEDLIMVFAVKYSDIRIRVLDVIPFKCQKLTQSQSYCHILCHIWTHFESKILFWTWKGNPQRYKNTNDTALIPALFSRNQT